MPLRNLEMGESILLCNNSIVNNEEEMSPETTNISKWVPFEKVNLCMCCRVTIFSMFNKRYHCRRCGRVICEPCSKYKMEVSGYGNVPVRVCQNCYHYFTNKMGEKKMNLFYLIIRLACWPILPASFPSKLSIWPVLNSKLLFLPFLPVIRIKCITSTDGFDGFPYSNNWKLTTDESKNSIVRQEFSYEFSPNVPLSLSIFDLLIGNDYSRILLDESEKMLKILHLHGKSNNPEVDCNVLLQIIRFLIESSKSKYKHLGLMDEIICCDELLDQVELLQMLIENSCINFIPSESLKGSGLIYLRNKLMEEELWEESMESYLVYSPL
ncbi:zinc finger protein FYVE domain containing protein, putative [Pediculus humanus corporis]|uniref:Zinc finger protein FYVE domain containing protein, putative n=1 Tax=Pediculus humanus subsp. corporis TaxID=121224 RepID=E0VSH6_PEDHC|nr:zinc finger protein FYVE domain containing protein, putative [Pediculus humanus corporis]EEB16332.1 zinc finger protein FYVE domain containing protein, putative [Pediculus humanus corporis]